MLCCCCGCHNTLPPPQQRGAITTFYSALCCNCRDMGYPVHYFQDGEGPCAGPPPPIEAPAPAPAGNAVVEAVAEVVEEEEEEQPELPMRSFSGWVGGMDSDAWSAASFTAALVAGACASLAQLWRTWRLAIHCAGCMAHHTHSSCPWLPPLAPAVVGSGVVAWSFLFDAFVDFKNCLRKRVA